MQCKCGCGQETSGREYVWGHKTKHIRPEIGRNLCACGCGELVRGEWAKGHCNRRPPKESLPCACGCGEMAAPGCRFLSGHASRTPKHIVTRRDRMTKLWKDSPEKFANRTVWSVGLTKQTDQRLMNVGRKIAATFTDEKRERYRELGREAAKYLRCGTGPESANWQGGITDFRKMKLEASESLYTRWKKPILDGADNTCQFCAAKWGETTESGDPVELHVHHNKETMSSVLRKFTVGIPDLESLPWDERISIWYEIIDYHVNTPVSGMVLCLDCHMRAHRKNPDVD